jgi:hypothetical protein
VELTLSADLRAVVHDPFLEGSLLRPGTLRVGNETLAARASAGLTLVLGEGVSVSYVHTVLTREFAGQGDVDAYGSVAMTVTW